MSTDRIKAVKREIEALELQLKHKRDELEELEDAEDDGE